MAIKSAREEAEATTTFSATTPPPAPARKTETLASFLDTHLPGKRTAYKGGFRHHAQSQGWVRATHEEWVARFDAFGALPA